jgi:Peptidase A4 family
MLVALAIAGTLAGVAVNRLAGGARLPAGLSIPAQAAVPAVGRGGRAESQNWSGYAATEGSFTGVGATWSVPEFAAEASGGADATWVGLGGVRSRDLIQAGTQETVSGRGTTRYQAWVETLPQASHAVPLVVHPGDSVSVSISQQGDTSWLIAFTNNTTGQSYQVTEQYRSSLSSAEWVEEAASDQGGRLIPLEHFGTVAFSRASAVKDRQTVTIADAGARPITMIGRGGQPRAQPSPLDTDGASFDVSRAPAP